MIDIDEKFKEYVSAYDMSDTKIKLKYNHSYRVKKMSQNLSEYLNLDEENKYLAIIIGLLHDIGRFEQIKLYDTFKDFYLDHADFGVKLLFEDGLIRKLVETDKYDTIIYTAIKNHNKLNIESSLDDITLMHSKIIRDADKIDILYLLAVLGEYPFKDDVDFIDNEVEKQFLSNKSVDNKNVKTLSDDVLRILSFVYDINYSFTYKYILDNKFIEKLYEKITNKELFKKYFDYVLEYMKERTNETC